MRVNEIMTEEVRAVDPGASIGEARELMRSNRIRHLVVMRGRSVVGVVSDRDLGGPRGPVPTGVVESAMSRPVVTIDAGSTLRQAANTLRGHGVGCLPVMDGGRLVGILTISDVLDVLGRNDAPRRGRARPYVARRQGPLGKPRGERLTPRGRRR